MMNFNNNRIPWYRIHIMTCLAVMVVGAALLWCQNVGSPTYPDPWVIGDGWLTGSYGWPLVYKTTALPAFPELHSLIAYVVNTIVIVVLMLGTGFIVEQVLRRVASRLQFSLTAALALITAVAVMFGERYAEFNMYVFAEQLNLHATLLIDYPWFLYVPIYFAIFCTLCSFAWIVVALISHWFRQFDR